MSKKKDNEAPERSPEETYNDHNDGTAQLADETKQCQCDTCKAYRKGA